MYKEVTIDKQIATQLEKEVIRLNILDEHINILSNRQQVSVETISLLREQRNEAFMHMALLIKPYFDRGIPE